VTRHPVLDRQAGVTLAEMLIALTLMLIVGTGALTTYDNAVGAYKQSRIAAEQQQGVRIAFEQILRDVQMAGLNANPDGHPASQDEAIEAAYDTAITVRADFDRDDPILSLVPETALAAGLFDVVTIGNDEIVTYVLAKPDGSSTGTMNVMADVDDPERDGSTEIVQLTNVELVHDDPPYTLYRITFNNDISTFGTPDFFVRTVLAENIGWLRFRYFDRAGVQLNERDLSTETEDIGGTSDVATRAKIQRIEIDLMGLAEDTDPRWLDWSDPNPATRPYRKFRMTADVRPRNNRAIGLVDEVGGNFGDL